MNDHRKKKIAPMIVSVVIILYYILYFSLLISLIKTFIIKIILGAIPLIAAALMISVCIQRLHEIDEGEEDDLNRY